MKTISHISIIVVTVFVLFSCGQTAEKEITDETTTSEVPVFEGQAELEAKIAERDDMSKWIPVNSLIYTHTDGSTDEASAFVNEKEEIVKLVHRYMKSKTQEYGSAAFYIENGKKIATIETYYDAKRKEPVFVERYTVYDSKEKPVFAKEREAEYEVDLETAVYKPVDAEDCSIKKAMQILNQEGPFVTTFQGFASNGEMDFVIVGENKEIGYTSSVAVQHREGDILKLYMDERGYVGTPLEVSFERMIDERDFEFQVLLSLKIKESKTKKKS
jgi:hypothetical protein